MTRKKKKHVGQVKDFKNIYKKLRNLNIKNTMIENFIFNFSNQVKQYA